MACEWGREAENAILYLCRKALIPVSELIRPGLYDMCDLPINTGRLPEVTASSRDMRTRVAIVHKRLPYVGFKTGLRTPYQIDGM